MKLDCPLLTDSILILYCSMSYDPMDPAASGLALAKIELIAPATRRAVQNCKEQQHFKCDPYSPYRTADGSCNNLRNPHWGTAFSCFTRLLPPAYADGLSAPRVSVTGEPLPNARILSSVLHRDLNYPATYTHMTMQYGQFFSHDIAFTPSSRTSKLTTIVQTLVHCVFISWVHLCLSWCIIDVSSVRWEL